MFDAVPLRILIVTLAGWVNRHQLEIIEYLREENRVLKEHVDGRRLPVGRQGRCGQQGRGLQWETGKRKPSPVFWLRIKRLQG